MVTQTSHMLGQPRSHGDGLGTLSDEFVPSFSCVSLGEDRGSHEIYWNLILLAV